jgi:hypothetical protein
VTDSSAIARVEIESLSKMGDLLGFAACKVLKAPQLANKMVNRASLRKRLGEQRRRLIVIR